MTSRTFEPFVTLYIIRGLPGSGKSSVAQQLVGDGNYFEADMYFTDENGVYRFDPKKLQEAHAWCFSQVQKAMESRYKQYSDNETGFSGSYLNSFDPVAVSNTFTQLWEMQPYIDLVKRPEYADWKVCIIEMPNNFGNTHGVPTEAIERMRTRWEKIGD
jgi:hypothetical protein